MEDASIEQFNFDLNKNHIFAIFDGHGGILLSNYRWRGRSFC